jgi:hypothetical protein
VKVYKAYLESGIEEIGDKPLNVAIDLIRSARQSEGNKEFGIGFYRSQGDFMEVRYVGMDRYLIWSDRIVGPLWKRLFSKHHIEKIVNGDQAALEAVTVYFEESRERFEKKYA